MSSMDDLIRKYEEPLYERYEELCALYRPQFEALFRLIEKVQAGE